MSTDIADEGPRPPGRRSIQLYGLPPIDTAPMADGGSSRSSVKAKSAFFSGMPGGDIASLNSTTILNRPDGQLAYLPTGSVLPLTSFASPPQRNHISAVSSIAAAGRGSGDSNLMKARQAATASPRHLRGRLNEGTVHRALVALPLPGSNTSARSQLLPQLPTTQLESVGSRGKGPMYGSSVVSWVCVSSDDSGQHRLNSNTRNDGSQPYSNFVDSSNGNRARSSAQPRKLRGATHSNTTATAAIVQMVNEASAHNTWAMRFTDTAALRQAVSTDADACTATEEALVAELNTLRQAPAAYAAIVEREATVGAPYVRPDDMYFASEAAAEEAAVQLRRRIEQEGAQEVQGVVTMTATATVSAITSAPLSDNTTNRLTAAATNASIVSPKHVSAAHNTSLHGGSALSGAPSTNATAATERKKAKKKQSSNSSATNASINAPLLSSTGAFTNGNATGGDSKDGVTKSKWAPEAQKAPERQRQGQQQQPPSSSSQRPPGHDQENSETVTPRPSVSKNRDGACGGPQALTLAELRFQFRCQQRYRAALEATLKELRTAQRQAEAAQLAAWAAEDEKAQKRARRFTTSPATATTSNNNNTTVGSLGSPGCSAVAGAGNVGGGATGFAKRLSAASSARCGSPVVEETIFVRRSEEAAQIQRVYAMRVQQLESELQRARSACRRSLAGGNLISSAVRALRAAAPVPPLRRSRGLSLAARDTAEMYYGDEERVTALQGLYALTRSTLVGLSDPNRQATTNAQPTQGAPEGVTSVSTLEGLARQREHFPMGAFDTDATSPPGVLPVLSEEALQLAQVAQQACTSYGYISNEVRGVHLQGVGSPRALMLQFILGSLTPVVDITHQPAAPTTYVDQEKPNSAADSVKATDANESSTQCYAGVRLEGKVYAAHPDVLSNNARSQDETPLLAQAPPRDDAYAGVFGAASDRGSFGGSKMGTAGPGGSAVALGEGTEDVLQRLWPLLWPGASAVGCGWQQVRGWRYVPTYTEAQQRIEAEQQAARLVKDQETAIAPAGTSSVVPSDNVSTVTMRKGGTAVVCSTLLLASGYEEFEVGRACSGMTPAATRRVIQELINGTDNYNYDGHWNKKCEMHNGSNAAAAATNDAPLAAVEVHSSLGVTLLTPTIHPVIVPPATSYSSPSEGGQVGSGSGGTVVCVAVRVPSDEASEQELQRGQGTGVAAATARSLTFADELSPSRSIRIVAQVTKQSDPTPSCPSVDAAVVLAQRSPADPSVWLVLVNMAAAFAQHTTAAIEQFDTSSSFRSPIGTAAAGTDVGVPLSVHLFAKDMCDVTASYEHVAFIRLKQGVRGDTVVGNAAGPLVLIEPEWRYLLKGLAGMPFAPVARTTPAATVTKAHSAVAAIVSGRCATYSSTASGETSGWAVLHEPLLGRHGVVLHPLSADLRASSCGSSTITGGIVAASTRATDFRGMVLADNASSVVCANEQRGKFTSAATAAGVVGSVESGRCGGCRDANAIHVAIQLPAHASVLWRSRRLATLKAAQNALLAEIAVEEEDSEERKDSSAVKEVKGRHDSSTTVANAGSKAKKSSEASFSAVTDVADCVSTVPNQDPGAETHNPPGVETEATIAVATASNTNTKATTSPSLTSSPPPAPPPSSICAASGIAARPFTPIGKKKSTAGSVLIKGRSKERGGENNDAASPEPKSGKTSAKLPSRSGDGGSCSSATPSFILAASANDGVKSSSSFSGLPSLSGGNRRRTLSFYLIADAPESSALRDYETLRKAPPSPQGSADARAIGVPPHLQPSHISLTALRALNERLRSDAQVWQAHLARIQPLLDSERERIAVEAVKKKGKEHQRLQHDQDDVAKEMAEMRRRVDVFQQAIDATWEAMRRRERAQVLRCARLAYVTAELADLQAAMGSVKLKNSIEREATSDAHTLATPRVTLRLISKAATAAGSGHNVMKVPAAASNVTVQSQANVLDLMGGGGDGEEDEKASRFASTVKNDNPSKTSVMCAANSKSRAAATAEPMSGDVVVLQPQPELSPPTYAGSSDGRVPAVVYAASCIVPPTFSGQATLLIDDEVAVTWTL